MQTDYDRRPNRFNGHSRIISWQNVRAPLVHHSKGTTGAARQACGSSYRAISAHALCSFTTSYSGRRSPSHAHPRESGRAPAQLVALPERYSWDPSGCCMFVLACELYFAEFPSLTDTQKISTLIQRLSGNFAEQKHCLHGLTKFKQVFDHPDQGQSSSQQLLKLRQGNESAADYSIHFRILAADSGWNNEALIIVFCNGLTPAL